MNGLQSLEQWQTYFNNPTGSLLGTIVAAQSIGSVIALPFLGNLCDWYGRKPILFTGLILICIAATIQCASVNLAMFIVARILIGIGGMFSSQPSPMLIAELAYPTHRGKYTSAYWTMYYLGAILSSWCTFGTQSLSGSWSWRTPSILQAGYPVVQLAFLYWVPESPRWLVAQNRIQEATDILKIYHAGQRNPDEVPSPLVSVEIAEISHAIELEKSFEATGWSALVATPGNFAYSLPCLDRLPILTTKTKATANEPRSQFASAPSHNGTA